MMVEDGRSRTRMLGREPIERDAMSEWLGMVRCATFINGTFSCSVMVFCICFWLPVALSISCARMQHLSFAE